MYIGTYSIFHENEIIFFLPEIYYHLWYQYEMLTIVLSGAGVSFQSNVNKIKTRTRKRKPGNKAKYNYFNGLTDWGNPTCFSANFLKAEKTSKWIDPKNSKRSSEPSFKTAAIRN